MLVLSRYNRPDSGYLWFLITFILTFVYKRRNEQIHPCSVLVKNQLFKCNFGWKFTVRRQKSDRKGDRGTFGTCDDIKLK